MVLNKSTVDPRSIHNDIPIDLPDYYKQKLSRYAKNLAILKANLIPPDGLRKPMTMRKRKSYSQGGQDLYVYKNMQGCNKPNGIFIEAGAYDGKFISNTLFFERYLNWTGLMVEADPTSFAKLLINRPNTWRLHGCLGSDPFEVQTMQLISTKKDGIDKAMNYLREMNGLHFVHDIYVGNETNIFETVTCYPLNMILDAIGWTHIDYLSLDIEGAEPKVLQTIDFNRYTFGALQVECSWCEPPGIQKIKRKDLSLYYETIKTKHFIQQFMKLNGYELVGSIYHDYLFAPKINITK